VSGDRVKSVARRAANRRFGSVNFDLRGVRGASICGLALLAVVSCSKSSEPAPAPAPTASPEPRATAATIRRFYPIACDANAASWKWDTCHDETKGFDPLLACTTAARDQAKAAAARLPPAQPTPDETSCGGKVDANTRAFVVGTAMYLDDVVTWLTAHRATLVGRLRASPLQDLDDDKLKAGMPHDYDSKYGSDVDAGDVLRFGWVGGMVCTKALYRCGTETDPSHKLTYVECGMTAAAARLGVECGTSSPYHHANGKPYCPAMICDLNNPRTWLYDATTGERIP